MLRRYLYYTGFLLTSLFLACQSTTDVNIETYRVQRGEFLSSVTETGELAAINSELISAPNIDWRFGQLKVIYIVDDGTQVQAGDTLVEFDKAEVEKAIIDARAELEIAQAELRKTMAQHASQIEGLEADLEQTRLQHRISQLNLEKATYESDIRRQEIELELEKAAISLEKAQKEIENQKAVNAEEISKLKLNINQVQSRLNEALNTLAKMTVTSPSPGIAIIERNWATDQKIAVEDQLWEGFPMISLPDLSLMKAEVAVNEVDIAKIDTMQDAFIRMDAFPDTSFKGHVIEVATLARDKERDSKVKVFDVVVAIDENSAQLMPGMTVGCQIIVDHVADTLFVPLEALFRKNGDNVVYVKKGGHFEPHPVVIGEQNQDFVIIVEGVREGEEVALIDPTLGVEEEEEQEEETS
ncbi:HlyD family efflux transporter periplasmic adaptor subunit [candidate division KSB1 bacterium]|nr:efflux RND transporter periplasmic adaptor subunit [candidate division KSB1 bacterium]RQW00881.1 MAG: HlyD family efflux transporter periplasmic adaptor subunit [candidate division KSB1 bacterium]